MLMHISGNEDSCPMRGQGADSHRASNPSSQKAYLHALGGGHKRNQDKLGGKGPPPKNKRSVPSVARPDTFATTAPLELLTSKDSEQGMVTWWTIGTLLLTNLFTISIFPTLWLESLSLPLLYFTYPLIHSSPAL